MHPVEKPYHGWTKEQLVAHWHKTVQTMRDLGDAMQRLSVHPVATPPAINAGDLQRANSQSDSFIARGEAPPTDAEKAKEAAFRKEQKVPKPKPISESPAKPAGPEVVQSSGVAVDDDDEDDE